MNLSEKTIDQLKIEKNTTSSNNNQEINSSRSKCQVVFHGDQRPENCDDFYYILAVRDKIIFLELDHEVPTEDMLPENESYLTTLIPEIWCWSVLSARSWYHEQTRARIISNTQLAQGTTQVETIQQYIEERL